MRGVLLIATISAILISQCTGNTIEAILNAFKDAPTKEQFKVFHHIFKKSYDLNSEEGIRRYKIFKENLKLIQNVNSQNLSYQFGINQFADLTKEEFTKQYLMPPEIKRSDFDKMVSFMSQDYFDTHADEDDQKEKNEAPVPAALNPIDWRPYYNAARNQNPCGSCWAFATTGLIEGHMGKQIGRPVPYLSPQQLVDCDTTNNGCSGGNLARALIYVRKNGVVKDTEYPYNAKVNTCKVVIPSTAVKIKTIDFCTFSIGTRSCSLDIVYKLLLNGPIAVGIDGNAIEFYKGGLFAGDTCVQDNHAVLGVGFGKDAPSGKYYWLVRNSWGTSWGESGYIRVSVTGVNNGCFVHNEAFTIGLP